MRREYFISRRKEQLAIATISKKITELYPDVNAENTLVLMVSPDYSATAAMHVAHHLSKDGEICDILPIHVPYPDELVDGFKDKADRDIDDFFIFCDKVYTNYLLVESGVIRGGTYTWITKLLKQKLTGRIITAALFENTHSKFKSDVVAAYYNDAVQDLTFYFERENKHWK